MSAQTFLYVYGAVCLSMIVFNIIYGLLLRGSETRMEKRCQRMREIVEQQLKLIRQGYTVSDRHLERLQRRLRHVNDLIAFDRVLAPLCSDTEDTAVRDYLQQIQPVILFLAVHYLRRDNVQAGYFSYFLSRYMSKRRLPVDSMQDLLLEYIHKDNLYCRVNALQAMLNGGNEEHIFAALQIQDDGRVFVHEKVLTESLLAYTGDSEALIRQLWEHFDAFSDHTRLAILNFIRFRSGRWHTEMFGVMQDVTRDKELRLAAIRYFGRYPYEPALEPLLTFASDSDPTHWEYVNVAVSALAQYEGARVIDTLKTALHSENWYVRYAAASSLDAHKVNYADLMDIVMGGDRYAREMMTYRLESRKMQEAGE